MYDINSHENIDIINTVKLSLIVSLLTFDLTPPQNDSNFVSTLHAAYLESFHAATGNKL